MRTDDYDDDDDIDQKQNKTNANRQNESRMNQRINRRPIVGNKTCGGLSPKKTVSYSIKRYKHINNKHIQSMMMMMMMMSG